MKKVLTMLIALAFLFTVGCSNSESTSIDNINTGAIEESSTVNTVPDNSDLTKESHGQNSTTSETAESSMLQPSSEQSTENNNAENTVSFGKRLVDMKEVSKKEFIKKYPFVMPADFETAVFYFEIPTELGLKNNEVENGYIRYSGNGVLHLYICKTKSVKLILIFVFSNRERVIFDEKSFSIVCCGNVTIDRWLYETRNARINANFRCYYYRKRNFIRYIRR